MKDFPKFMMHEQNRIDASEQNTDGVEGYVYDGVGGGQMAVWTCRQASESAKHTHDFDEYMVVVSGKYTLCTDDGETALGPGDEILIPAGTTQWGRCSAGTRTIHAFGGRRIQKT